MKSIRILLLVLLALLLVQGCGNSTVTGTATPTASTEASETLAPEDMPTAAAVISAQADSSVAIATVNGQELSYADFEVRFAAEQALFQQQPDYDLSTTAGQQALARFRSGLLDRMIDEMLIEQIVVAMELTIDESELQSAAEAQAAQTGQELSFALQQVKNDMYAEIVMEAITADLDRVQPQVHVKQILAADIDQANAALAELESGAAWDQVAAKYSIDASVTEDGGDLGFIPAGVMPPAFDDAAFALEPGEYSGVVESETGIHIILLVEESDSLSVPDTYWQAVQQQTFTDWLASYREASTILLAE